MERSNTYYSNKNTIPWPPERSLKDFDKPRWINMKGMKGT